MSEPLNFGAGWCDARFRPVTPGVAQPGSRDDRHRSVEA